MTNELSMKELLDQQEQQLDKLQVGELITSSITKVSHGAVIISLECGFDGVIALDDLNIEEGKEIADVYKVGDEISAVITKVSPKDGTVRLSKVLADQENDLKELEVAHNEHKIVTVKVEKAIQRGLFAKYKTVQLFMPISQIDTKFVNDTKEYVGQELDVYVLEVNRENNRIALAVKDINNDPWKLIAQEVAVGDVITGKVVRTIERGAFVEIKEGVEAYLPISQLSENRVPTVNSVVNPGDEIEAKIAKVNKTVTEKGLTASVVMANEGSISTFSAKSRYGLIYNGLGFAEVDKNIDDSTHGQQVSFEYFLENKSDYVFVVDRGAVTGKGEAASKLFDNEVMNKTEVAKNGNIVYLNSVIWYTMTGGIESTNQMIDEIADAVK